MVPQPRKSHWPHGPYVIKTKTTLLPKILSLHICQNPPNTPPHLTPNIILSPQTTYFPLFPPPAHPCCSLLTARSFFAPPVSATPRSEGKEAIPHCRLSFVLCRFRQYGLVSDLAGSPQPPPRPFNLIHPLSPP